MNKATLFALFMKDHVRELGPREETLKMIQSGFSEDFKNSGIYRRNHTQLVFRFAFIDDDDDAGL